MMTYTTTSSTLSLGTLVLLASRTLVSAGSSSSSPSAGTSYQLSPKSFPDMCIVPSSDSEGASLVITECASSCDTEWVWDGKALHNVATDKCMDLTDGSAKSGNHPQIWSCYSWNPNQAWVQSGNHVKWNGANQCLDLTDGNGDEGTKVQVWTCHDNNPNQQWDLVEVVDGDNSGSSGSGSATAPSPSSSSIGGNLAAGGGGINVGIGANVSIGGGHHNTGGNHNNGGGWGSSPSASASASTPSASSGWGNGGNGGGWGGNNGSDGGDAGSGGNGNADMSGYLQVKGTKVVDPQGNEVMLKGTNIGGWLVWEDWMCGIHDNSGSADRFPQTTLDNRFGTDATYALMKVWQDNWFVESDFDVLAEMGFNVIRLPFSYKNFIFPNGSYVQNAQGDIDFSRLDWAVSQAKKRGIYVIPTYHIWDGQEQQYSTISENSDEGQDQRNKAGKLWTKIAAHFVGEPAIAAYDMINEPTGSWGNLLQKDLYTAIRQGDSKRIIIMESISSWPESDWSNVMYSMHEYNMMGEDNEGYNQQQYWNGVWSDVTTYNANGLPAYIGEFMASGDTLSWMLGQMNDKNLWWSGWTYKTVNMDRWGLMNFGGGNWVDVSSDSYESLQNAWSNMGGISKSRVYDVYTQACQGNHWKRSAPSGPLVTVAQRADDDIYEAEFTTPVQRSEISPRVEQPEVVPRVRRSHRHAGRSRRYLGHGKSSHKL